jgi:hypothetical protein
MREWSRRPGRRPGEQPFAFIGRRRAPGPGPAAAVVVVILLLAGGFLWYRFLGSRQDPQPPLVHGDTAADPAPASTAPAPHAPPLELPPLDASDAFLRGLVARLSAHPQLAAWLVTDQLVHRFVVSVLQLAEGASPAAELRVMAPAGEFRVRESAGRLFIDPSGYRRYDRMAETLASIDAGGGARLYRQLLPLFDQAYHELGFPGRSFDVVFTRAVANLLAFDIADRQWEVVPNENVYAFADARVEARSPAEKHLLRMGPANAHRIRTKLAEVADSLGMAARPIRTRDRAARRS